MWISRAAFDTLNAERIKASEEARVLFNENAHLKGTVAWAIQRVEHVEIERRLLLKQYMGVNVPTPTFVKPEADVEEVLGGANIFKDIGDAAALRLGMETYERLAVK